MIDNKYQRNPYNSRLVLAPLLTIVILVMAFSTCQETVFPDNPPSHQIIKAMEEWPDEYYWLVKSGVSSRVLGIRSEGENIEIAIKKVDSLLTLVKQQWTEITTLDSSEKLILYFQDNNLSPVAEVIERTITINAAQEPTGEWHYWLQAKAIKDGLIDAYNKIKEDMNE